MLVHVTQEHIELGQRGSCRSCPVALAMKQATGMITFAGTSLLRWGFVDGSSSFAFEMHTPEFVAQFMDEFDQAGSVHPFTFELVEERHLKW